MELSDRFRGPPPVHTNPGHYARKQLLSRSRLVRFSHGSRFRLARELVERLGGRCLLDYGCGDGTFLDRVGDLFVDVTGADVDEQQIVDCRERLAAGRAIRFLTTAELDGPVHRERYDVIVCMEVLEHCPDDIQRDVLAQIDRVMAFDGALVISVPIETGPTLVAKQTARGLLALRGFSEYSTRERYRPLELMRMVFAGANTRFAREEVVGHTSDGRVTRYTGHKGFNWLALERQIEATFAIERRLFSPFPLLGAWLNSQVWFVCRKR